jgi:hypothetical protein
LIKSGQFHARFEFGIPTVSQQDHFLFNIGGIFTATYHLFLFEDCLVLCREAKPSESLLWISRVVGIIDFRRGRLIRAHVERKGSNSPANPLRTMIFEWTGLDRKPYRIALAPCDDLEMGPAICESWVSAMHQTEFRNSAHNWPLILEQQVSWHFNGKKLITQGSHSVIEFLIKGKHHDCLNSFIFQSNLKLDNITFLDLIQLYVSRRFHRSYHSCTEHKVCNLPTLRRVDCYYEDSSGRLVAISEQFPLDTDMDWRRFCFARFWLQPIKKNSYSFWHALRRHGEVVGDREACASIMADEADDLIHSTEVERIIEYGNIAPLIVV